MDYISEKASFEEFRLERAILFWVTHTRPEVTYRLNRMAQVTERTFFMLLLTVLSWAVHFSRNRLSPRSMLPSLDLASLHMRF